MGPEFQGTKTPVLSVRALETLMSAVNSAIKVRVFLKSAELDYMKFGEYSLKEWCALAPKLKVGLFGGNYVGQDNAVYYSAWKLNSYYTVRQDKEDWWWEFLYEVK